MNDSSDISRLSNYGDLKSEDKIINRTNEYHKHIIDVNFQSNIKENMLLFGSILVPTVIMFYIFRLNNRRSCTSDSLHISNVMFSLMVVSVVLTLSESIYIYGYVIENVYNMIMKTIDDSIDFDRYLDIKIISNLLPNVIYNETKTSYESNLQSKTFLMFLPILLICIFMLTSLTGCLKLNRVEMFGIFLNVIILLVIFAITFVNLGMYQSDHVDYKKVADTFDPYKNVHRFQTNYEFMSDITSITFLSILIVFISLFITFIYLYD